MKRQSLRKKLDYLPLLILTALTIIFIFRITTANLIFSWKHYLAIILLLLAFIIFFLNHKAGVLTSGFVLLLGLIGFISFTQGIVSSNAGVGGEDISLKIHFGDPLFILLLLLHFILSGKYYFGIGTKKYWKDLFESKTAE